MVLNVASPLILLHLLVSSLLQPNITLSHNRLPDTLRACINTKRVFSYMLLLFPGELMERFLLWLMEPPMATGLLQMLQSCLYSSPSRLPAQPPRARWCVVPHDQLAVCPSRSLQPQLLTVSLSLSLCRCCVIQRVSALGLLLAELTPTDPADSVPPPPHSNLSLSLSSTDYSDLSGCSLSLIFRRKTEAILCA